MNTRKLVWESLLDSEGLSQLKNHSMDFAKWHMDGRQIRDLVRLAKFAAEGSEVQLDLLEKMAIMMSVVPETNGEEDKKEENILDPAIEIELPLSSMKEMDERFAILEDRARMLENKKITQDLSQQQELKKNQLTVSEEGQHSNNFDEIVKSLQERADKYEERLARRLKEQEETELYGLRATENYEEEELNQFQKRMEIYEWEQAVSDEEDRKYQRDKRQPEVDPYADIEFCD